MEHIDNNTYNANAAQSLGVELVPTARAKLNLRLLPPGSPEPRIFMLINAPAKYPAAHDAQRLADERGEDIAVIDPHGCLLAYCRPQ